MLERHPEIDVVKAGTAIAAEAAMGEGRNLKNAAYRGVVFIFHIRCIAG